MILNMFLPVILTTLMRKFQEETKRKILKINFKMIKYLRCEYHVSRQNKKLMTSEMIIIVWALPRRLRNGRAIRRVSRERNKQCSFFFSTSTENRLAQILPCSLLTNKFPQKLRKKKITFAPSQNIVLQPKYIPPTRN